MTQQDIELIDDYLGGSLSDSEKEKLEIRLKEDNTFSELFHQIKIIREAAILNEKEEWLKRIKATGKQEDSSLDINAKKESMIKEALILQSKKELLNKVKQWDSEEVPQNINRLKDKASNTSRLKTILIPLVTLAASFALLYYFLWISPNDNAYQKIVAEHFEAFPAVGLTKSIITDTKDSLKRLALVHYSNENWHSAYTLFEEVQNEYGDTISLFYQGIAYLADGKNDLAIKTINQFLSSASMLNLKAPAQWYLSLSYIHAEQSNLAIPILNQLLSDPDYHEESKRLLAALNTLDS